MQYFNSVFLIYLHAHHSLHRSLWLFVTSVCVCVCLQTHCGATCLCCGFLALWHSFVFLTTCIFYIVVSTMQKVTAVTHYRVTTSFFYVHFNKKNHKWMRGKGTWPMFIFIGWAWIIYCACLCCTYNDGIKNKNVFYDFWRNEEHTHLCIHIHFICNWH